MKTSHLIIGAIVLAGGAYFLVNRSKSDPGVAAASAEPAPAKPASVGVRVLGALGAALSNYSGSGNTIARTTSSSSAATSIGLDRELGALDSTVDSFIS